MGPNDPQTAAALTTLADLYGAQNKFAEAEPLLKRAIAIHEKAKKPDNGEIAQALDNLSSLYVKQGRTADAAPLAKRAADLRANVPAAPAETKVGAGKEETPAGATQESTPAAPAEAQAKDGDDKAHHAKKAKLADKPAELTSRSGGSGAGRSTCSSVDDCTRGSPRDCAASRDDGPRRPAPRDFG